MEWEMRAFFAEPEFEADGTTLTEATVRRAYFTLTPPSILQIRDLLADMYANHIDPIPRGLFNRGAVEGAVERAVMGPFPPGVTPDVFVRTAFLVRGLCQEHAFANGNKRTGFMVAFINLDLNGLRLETSNEEVYQFMMAVANGELEPLEMADWYRGRCHPSGDNLALDAALALRSTLGLNPQGE